MLLGMTVIFPWRGLTADSIRWALYPEQNIATIQKILNKNASATLIDKIATNDIANEMRIIKIAMKN